MPSRSRRGPAGVPGPRNAAQEPPERITQVALGNLIYPAGILPEPLADIPCRRVGNPFQVLLRIAIGVGILPLRLFRQPPPSGDSVERHACLSRAVSPRPERHGEPYVTINRRPIDGQPSADLHRLIWRHGTADVEHWPALGGVEAGGVFRIAIRGPVGMFAAARPTGLLGPRQQWPISQLGSRFGSLTAGPAGAGVLRLSVACSSIRFPVRRRTRFGLAGRPPSR